MARLVVDPVTRIEGHLRIEAQVDGGKISDAWSAGTMFRGIELILQGPRSARSLDLGAAHLRSVHHGARSGQRPRRRRRAPDRSSGKRPHRAQPDRRLADGAGSRDPLLSSARARLGGCDARRSRPIPAKTSQIAQSISDYEKSSATYFRGVQQRVKGVVDSGQLSLFASGYWGHPAYHLPPEVNLLAVAHYLEALAWQKDFIRIHAVLGGKNPHPQTFLVGGMSTAMDPNEPFAVINPERITFLRELVKRREEIRRAGLHSRRARHRAASIKIGSRAAKASAISCPTAIIPRAIRTIRAPSCSRAAWSWAATSQRSIRWTRRKITESVSHSWYDYSDGDKPPSIPRRRDQSQVLRAQAALRFLGRRQEILLAEGPALSTASRWKWGRWRAWWSATPPARRTSRRRSTAC